MEVVQKIAAVDDVEVVGERDVALGESARSLAGGVGDGLSEAGGPVTGGVGGLARGGRQPLAGRVPGRRCEEKANSDAGPEGAQNDGETVEHGRHGVINLGGHAPIP